MSRNSLRYFKEAVKINKIEPVESYFCIIYANLIELKVNPIFVMRFSCNFKKALKYLPLCWCPKAGSLVTLLATYLIVRIRQLCRMYTKFFLLNTDTDADSFSCQTTSFSNNVNLFNIDNLANSN